MNKVELTGRQVREAVLRYTANSNTAVLDNCIAVDRRGKDGGVDFIDFTAFGSTAEFMDRYGAKGKKWNVVGRLQTDTYEKDGQKRKITKVIVEEAEFGESKASEGNTAQPTEPAFMDIPDNIGDELPFN